MQAREARPKKVGPAENRRPRPAFPHPSLSPFRTEAATRQMKYALWTTCSSPVLHIAVSNWLPFVRIDYRLVFFFSFPDIDSDAKRELQHRLRCIFAKTSFRTNGLFFPLQIFVRSPTVKRVRSARRYELSIWLAASRWLATMRRRFYQRDSDLPRAFWSRACRALQGMIKTLSSVFGVS